MARNVRHFGSGALALAASIITSTTSALACACCSHPAWRYVEVERLGAKRLAEIEQMDFAKTAKLMTTEADVAIKGIDDPSTDYRLELARRRDRFTFALRDTKGRGGTLTLAMPKSISIFEVDPRGDDKDTGLGPSLYKEWKLTAHAAGGGLFRRVVGPGQKLTLVLHGRGRGCTDASHFTDWTLMVYGPVARFSFYGALAAAAR
jgi:hypothetical protein